MKEQLSMATIKDKLDASYQQLTAPGAPWELEHKIINGIPYRLYKNAPKTVKELVDAGRQYGDKEFLVYQAERWSFNRFFHEADHIARLLYHDYGIRKGDRVAIAMRNYPEWMVAFVAISNLGAVVVCLNSWWQREELTYGLTDAAVRVLFCDQRRYDHVADLLPDLGVKTIVARPTAALKPSQAIDMAELVASTDVGPLPEVEVYTEDPALIMYTSGTTGNPKGALSNQRNVCQSTYNFELAAIAAAMTDPESVARMLQKGFEQKSLLGVPLFHISGSHAVFLLSLRAGRSIVILHKWDVEEALRLVETEKITVLSAVPTILVEMLESPLWEKHDTSSLFGFGAGGAAQPLRLPELIRRKLPDAFPGTGYGTTETNAAGFSSTGPVYLAKPLSAGVLTPIMEVKFCDDQGREVPPGEPGEIWLRGPTVVQGYWNKPAATAECFRDGWMITGDIGYLDDEGYLFVTDRVKDMVIRGGENIYSAEVEAVIASLPEVFEVAAFGIPHDTLGEELAVVVRTRTGAKLTAEAVQRHVAGKLAAFKVPAHVFFRNEELPKNAVRKVLKKDLRAEYIGLLRQRQPVGSAGPHALERDGDA
jgi:long-chain acyl-CoA synthetase